MKESTEKLLQQLAEKLGTTTEYLWSILLKQAPIEATIALFQTICVIFFGLILWKIHKRLLKKDGEYSQTVYDRHEDAGIVMIIAAVIFAILSIICFCCIGDIVIGYCNPEYWALRQVLNNLNN